MVIKFNDIDVYEKYTKKTTNRNISILKTKLNNLINFGTTFLPLLHAKKLIAEKT